MREIRISFQLFCFSLVFAFIVSASNSSAERRRKAAQSRDSQYSIGAEDDFSQHYGASAPMTSSSGAGYSDNPPYSSYNSENPPYNPGYDVSPYYGGGSNMINYPTGTVPPPTSHQPLLHQAPPR